MKQILAELFETYYKDIYAYLYSLCHNASLAEDLTSEVFLSVVRSISGFRGEADIRTWLYAIARRKWYAWLRWKQKQIPGVSIQDLCNVPDPRWEENVTAGDLMEIILEILASETKATQQVVQLRAEGYSYYEIGKRLNITESSARVIFFRAKTKIKEYLIKEGFPHDRNHL